MKFASLMLLLTATLVSSVGCFGTVVPPGKNVVVLHADGSTEVVENGAFFVWGRSKAFYVDEKFKSFTEDVSVLCADEIAMNVDCKVLVSIDASVDNASFLANKIPTEPTTAMDYPELSLDSFYQTAVADIARSTARSCLSPLQSEEINVLRDEKAAEIQQLLTKRCEELGYPIHISAVTLSDVGHPEAIKKMRETIKAAQLKDQESAALAEAQLAQAKREVAIEQENAKVRMVIAQAQADENKILSDSLTPEFLAWHQMESLELVANTLATGPNNTVFLFPYQMSGKEMLDKAMMQDAVKQKPTSPTALQLE